MLIDMVAYCSEIAHVWVYDKKTTFVSQPLYLPMSSFLSVRAEEAEPRAPVITITTCTWNRGLGYFPFVPLS